MSTLSKDVVTLIELGSPGSPGLPGVAPTPAYCTTTPYTTQSMDYKLVPVPNDQGGISYEWMAFPGEPVTAYKTTCFPATAGSPPIPAVAGTPTTTTLQYSLGWNAGARSIETLAGDGAATFTVPTDVVGVVVGFDSGALEYSRFGTEHALYFRSGLVNVIERGMDKTGSAPYVSTDVFRIERSGTVIRYYKGATLLYTSTAPSHGEQYLESTMYSGGDAVIGAELVDAVTAGAGSSGAGDDGAGGSLGAMRPLTAYGGNVSATNVAQGAAVLRPLTASASGSAEQGGSAVMAGLQAIGSASGYSGSGSIGAASPGMQPLDAVGGGMLEGDAAPEDPDAPPAYALGTAAIGYLVANGYGLTSGNTTGEAAASTTPALIGLGGNYDYGGGSGALEPLSAKGMQLSGWASITSPVGTVLAFGHDSTGENSASITSPAPTVTAYGGGNSAITGPAGTVQATGTVIGIARARITSPVPTIMATGTVSAQAMANITSPAPTITAYGGANCTISAPAGKVQATGTIGGIFSGVITSPAGKISAAGTVGSFFRVSITSPAGKLADTMRASITGPSGKVSTTGTVGADLVIPEPPDDFTPPTIPEATAQGFAAFGPLAATGSGITAAPPVSGGFCGIAPLAAIGADDGELPIPETPNPVSGGYAGLTPLAATSSFFEGVTPPVNPVALSGGYAGMSPLDAQATALVKVPPVVPMGDGGFANFMALVVAGADATGYSNGAGALLPLQAAGRGRSPWDSGEDAGDAKAYSINLTHEPSDAPPVNQVTRYLDFPFTSIVRYKGQTFATGPGGLYLLEGDTDNGAEIFYSVKTAVSDLKTPNLKNVASAYLSGRIGPLTIILHAGEDGRESYQFHAARGPAPGNHREKFGRGVRNRYFSLAMTGMDEMELDAIELEVNKMNRKI